MTIRLFRSLALSLFILAGYNGFILLLFLFFIFSNATDLFFVLEVDVYGHFFQKATTKVARESTVLHYDQDFVIDLYGSEILRIICYEQVPGHNPPLFRGKTQVELSSSWLTDKFTEKDLAILDVSSERVILLCLKLTFILDYHHHLS